MLRIVFISILLFGVINCFAQTSQPTPQPKSARGRDDSTAQNQRISSESNKSFEALRQIEIPVINENSPKNISNEKIQAIYRKPDKEDIEIIAPSPALLTQYEKFLQKSNTGIIKLNGDSQCFINSSVIVVGENCSSYKLPGAGTAYSFRIKSYQMQHLADLILVKDVLKTDGILQQGIMVNLGNVEIEPISAQTNGLKYLFDFKPATNKEDFAKNDKQLSEGIQKDGFIYRFGFYAEDKTTFAFRSIAYRGKLMRSVDGIVYNEFDFDKRKDIIVVFRIIDKDSNGDITILWKELSRQDSPTLNIDQKNK